MPRVAPPTEEEKKDLGLHAVSEEQPALQLDDWAEPFGDWLLTPAKTKAWLIDGLIPMDSLVLLSGHQKRAAKTYFALAVAIAIATNKANGELKPIETGNVLFVEEEGSHAETQTRALAVIRAMGLDPEESREALNKIRWVFRKSVQLDRYQWQARLKQAAELLQPVLTIFDAVFALHSGDENKVSDMAPIIKTFNHIRNVSGGGSVLYLAHLDKDRGENPKKDIDTQVRGSGVLVNAYDTHLAARRYSEHDHEIAMKVRYRDREPQDWKLRWEFEKKDGNLDKAHLIIYKKIEQPYSKAPTTFEHGAEYTRGQIGNILGKKGKEVQDAIEDLLNVELFRTGKGKYQYRDPDKKEK